MAAHRSPGHWGSSPPCCCSVWCNVIYQRVWQRHLPPPSDVRASVQQRACITGTLQSTQGVGNLRDGTSLPDQSSVILKMTDAYRYSRPCYTIVRIPISLHLLGCPSYILNTFFVWPDWPLCLLLVKHHKKVQYVKNKSLDGTFWTSVIQANI